MTENTPTPAPRIVRPMHFIPLLPYHISIPVSIPPSTPSVPLVNSSMMPRLVDGRRQSSASCKACGQRGSNICFKTLFLRNQVCTQGNAQASRQTVVPWVSSWFSSHSPPLPSLSVFNCGESILKTEYTIFTISECRIQWL